MTNIVKSISVFTDCSYSPQKKYGVIGFYISETTPLTTDLKIDEQNIFTKIKTSISNTALEIEAVIIALDTLINKCKDENQSIQDIEIHIYTDCETVVNLPERREKLNQNKFLSKKTGKPLGNAALYREFYKLFDLTLPHLHWVKGHKKNRDKSLIDQNFSLVDKKVRNTLREFLNKP